ncbi:putative reverse transcriptase domain-containing protein [Tanacetum coccineum]
MAESAKRHEENSNIIKEIRASTDAAIRNQGASIKTLEIQIGQMSKVLQERGIKSLPSSTKLNLRGHVKSISTAKVNSSVIRRIGSGPYVVSDTQYSSLSSEVVSFPNRLHGASVSVMPFSTYSNLGLDFVILDIPEDDDVPLILGRPFLSTAHAKIDVFKRKFTLRDKGDHEGKNLVGTLIDIPIFVGNLSIILGFSIIDDIDITSGVVLGMPFCKKFVSCQKIMERFAHGDKYERMNDE